MSNALTQTIKSLEWDNRVQRPGFLQPKSIVNWAEVQPFQLTESITFTYDNVCWINRSNLYDDKKTCEFLSLFPKAFEESQNFPLDLVHRLDSISREVQNFLTVLHGDVTGYTYEELVNVFEQYVSLLLKVQHYYVVAVPLTNYCESVLQKNNVDYLPFSVPYKKLDVDRLEQSLQQIVHNPSGTAIEDHRNKFAWIKTNYNIITPYTVEDVQAALNTSHSPSNTRQSKTDDMHVTGLQVGIYIRNRIKELSQQLWFSIDPTIRQLADECSVSRDEFLYHTLGEARSLLKNQRRSLTKKDLEQRKKGFAVGIIDRESFVFTGAAVDELYHYFNDVDGGKTEVAGQVACKGNVTGTVRIIKDQSDFDKLQKGDVLVTSMTTPDFVVIMKRAGAIVTDEGGLSCHAAIVSRELGVPCIIGTKVATKVLHDGEQVEVDAERGLVKRL